MNKKRRIRNQYILMIAGLLYVGAIGAIIIHGLAQQVTNF